MTGSLADHLIVTLQERLGIPAETVTPDSTLDALDLDAAGLAQLAVGLRQDLEVSIDAAELTLEHTVGEVAALLSTKGATAP